MQPPFRQPRSLHKPSTQLYPIHPRGMQSSPVHTPLVQSRPEQPKLAQRIPTQRPLTQSRPVQRPLVTVGAPVAVGGPPGGTVVVTPPVTVVLPLTTVCHLQDMKLANVTNPPCVCPLTVVPPITVVTTPGLNVVDVPPMIVVMPLTKVYKAKNRSQQLSQIDPV